MVRWCGVGISGTKGIEIQKDYFDILYEGVAQKDEYDQVLFYELGRNFWFYGDKIEYKGPDDTGSITTGYAVFMRFMSMEAAGVKPGPYGDTDFAEFESAVREMLDLYIADDSLNWSNTLLVGQAPENPLGLGATDLFASFLFELTDTYGQAFIAKLWQEVGKGPDAASTQEAVDNFIVAASITAGEDLTALFSTWKWPVSENIKQADF